LIFNETPLAGAFVIDVDRRHDERGFFARTWSEEEFRERGLNPRIVQCSVSFNDRRGTLRGMHYQEEPHGETKLVRCTAGAIHDVIVDLRPDSPTFRRSFAAELSAENRRMLYIPKSFAHGFITLTDAAEVFYQMGNSYQADAARGLRWNDPKLGIDWPLQPVVMNRRDAEWPLID
jgi:dTDP-4-dehydrorhamnose 3,5-epimerase